MPLASFGSETVRVPLRSVTVFVVKVLPLRVTWTVTFPVGTVPVAFTVTATLPWTLVVTVAALTVIELLALATVRFELVFAPSSWPLPT